MDFPRWPIDSKGLIPDLEGHGGGGASVDSGSTLPENLIPPLSNVTNLIPHLPPLPNVTKLIPQLPTKPEAVNITIPKIPGLPPLPSLDNVPGLSQAIDSARNRMESALGIAGNFVDGIQKALEQAFEGGDPTGAIRTLVNTILDAYLFVASKNPMFIIAYRVIQEGIKIASEIAKAASNVVFG